MNITIIDNATNSSFKKFGYFLKYNNWILTCKSKEDFQKTYIDILKIRNFLLITNDKNDKKIIEINKQFDLLMNNFFKQIYKNCKPKIRTMFMASLFDDIVKKQFYSIF